MRRASISIEKLTPLGEKPPKSSPDPPGWGLDTGLATRLQKTNFAVKSQSSIASWINRARTMQHKRMKTTEFNIAAWNDCSILQAGKMEEIADELKKHTKNSITRSEMATRQLD